MRVVFGLVLVVVTGGVLSLAPAQPTAAGQPAPARAGNVILAGAMPEQDLIALSAAVAATQPDTDFVLDSNRAEMITKPFLDRLKPASVTPVGTFSKEHNPAKRWGIADPVLKPTEADPIAFAWSLFPKADRVVVTPRVPTNELLQAACLAGTLKAPLFVLRDGAEPTAGLKELISSRGVKDVLAVGNAVSPCKKLDGVKITEFADATAVVVAHHKELLRTGKIDLLVLTNPSDPQKLHTLAPWVAIKRRAPLLLTCPDGKDAAMVVAAAMKNTDTARADAMLVVADPTNIPQVKRENPAKGKDEQIDVEPWVPDGDDLISLTSGRLFHADRSVVTLMLARQKLLDRTQGSPKILIASNPGDGLPLLETFSRNTGRELENAGWKVTGRYGKTNLTAKELRELLPEQDAFLWEGHYRTLIDTYEFPKWTEPLRPSVIFLQSCLALNVDEAALLFDRGAVSVVGTPNRTYSGSGGALTLGFFDSLAYDGRSTGASMRHAKNFLVCYAELKAKRLGEAAKLGGANQRAAWTFTIWGDPTVKMPKAVPAADALPAMKCEMVKTTITIMLPEKKYPSTEVPPYKAEMWPGGRLAGLITTDIEDKWLSPLGFAEVSMPNGPADQVPHLSSKLPSKNWVFRWDARLRVGYLLVIPREKDEKSIEFRVKWEPAAAS